MKCSLLNSHDIDVVQGEVALWQLSWLTVASPILANDPGNYFSGNAALLLGLTEIELFDQDGEQVFFLSCVALS